MKSLARLIDAATKIWAAPRKAQRPELSCWCIGSKERRQRHRTRIREAILVTARELFVAEGVRNVLLRQIADRIEYGPAALHTYFCCKDDIFLTLAEEDEFVIANPLFVALMILLETLLA